MDGLHRVPDRAACGNSRWDSVLKWKLLALGLILAAAAVARPVRPRIFGHRSDGHSKRSATCVAKSCPGSTSCRFRHPHPPATSARWAPRGEPTPPPPSAWTEANARFRGRGPGSLCHRGRRGSCCWRPPGRGGTPGGDGDADRNRSQGGGRSSLRHANREPSASLPGRTSLPTSRGSCLCSTQP